MTPTSSTKREPHNAFTLALAWFRKRSLSEACLLVIVGALVVAVLAWLLIGFPLIQYPTWGIGTGDRLRTEALKIVLTMVAGIGGIIALTIAYRKQRGTEEVRFMASLENAARQMGAQEPTIQFAGIYALASLADESNDERKQKCVDVLCGYLRLPYMASGELSTLREVTEKRSWFDTRGEVQETRTHRLRPAEKEVRLTIIRTITERLQVGAQNSWSELEMDFTGAVFDDGDFSGAHFRGAKVNFSMAKFAGGRVDFSGAHFDTEATFKEAKFAGSVVIFFKTKFNQEAIFSDSALEAGVATFQQAEFNAGLDFQNTHLAGGMIDFIDAKFNRGGVNFGQMTFDNGEVSFERAKFNKGEVSFGGAKFPYEYPQRPYMGRLMTVAQRDQTYSDLERQKTKEFEGNFSGVEFNGAHVSFYGTTFNRGITFLSPGSWNSPPKVPWGDGIPPPGVRPSEWPPLGPRT